MHLVSVRTDPPIEVFLSREVKVNLDKRFSQLRSWSWFQQLRWLPLILAARRLKYCSHHKVFVWLFIPKVVARIDGYTNILAFKFVERLCYALLYHIQLYKLPDWATGNEPVKFVPLCERQVVAVGTLDFWNNLPFNCWWLFYPWCTLTVLKFNLCTKL